MLHKLSFSKRCPELRDLFKKEHQSGNFHLRSDLTYLDWVVEKMKKMLLTDMQLIRNKYNQ